MSTKSKITDTEMSELSTTMRSGRCSTIIDSETTVELDTPRKGSRCKVDTVICLAIIFMLMGKIAIPILVTLTVSFEFIIIDDSMHSTGIIHVASCSDPQSDALSECTCSGAHYIDADVSCSIHFSGSYIEYSIAVNSMVCIVEILWFIRMLYGCSSHSLRSKLGIFTAIGHLTKDSKCCLFVWRLFELAWYIAIYFQFDELQCECVQPVDEYQLTQKGVFYALSRYLDFIILAVIALYIVCKIVFYYLMNEMMNSLGAYYDMGPFWAVLKVQYMTNRAFTKETSLSDWTPLKQELNQQEDLAYEAKKLRLHYKSWK